MSSVPQFLSRTPVLVAAMLYSSPSPADPLELVLEEDLVLGLEESAPLGNPADLAVDSQGNIYILDTGFKVIRKFSAEAKHLMDLGGEGEGPGKFYGPICLALGPDARVYVAGQSGLITVLESDGRAAGQMKSAFAGSPIVSICLDGRGSLFTVCLDPVQHRMIHRYDTGTNEPVASFCNSWATGKDIQTQLEKLYAGGFIDIGFDSLLYYVQRTPQLVRIFDSRGELLATHAARNDESPPPPEPTYHEGGGATFRLPPISTTILALPGHRFLTSLLMPGEKKDGRRIQLDLYDQAGELVGTASRTTPFYPLGKDDQGRIYVSESREDLPVVVRYSLRLK